jgi:hypothetical protein
MRHRIPIAVAIVVALLVAAVHWFNYCRIATYKMRWTTGEQAGFNTYGSNLAPNGNPKISFLLPADQPQCYMTSYNRDLLAYLRKEDKPTIAATLELHYSYGKIYSFTVVRFGDDQLRDEFYNLASNSSGDCFLKYLDRYAEPPGPGERYSTTPLLR